MFIHRCGLHHGKLLCMPMLIHAVYMLKNKRVFGSLQCREFDKRLFIKGNKVSKSHTPSMGASGVWGSCKVVSPSLKEAKESVFPTTSQVLAQYICCPSTCTSCFPLDHASAFGV